MISCVLVLHRFHAATDTEGFWKLHQFDSVSEICRCLYVGKKKFPYLFSQVWGKQSCPFLLLNLNCRKIWFAKGSNRCLCVHKSTCVNTCKFIFHALDLKTVICMCALKLLSTKIISEYMSQTCSVRHISSWYTSWFCSAVPVNIGTMLCCRRRCSMVY